MNPKLLRQYFDEPESAVDWLTGLEITESKTAIKNLQGMASCDPTLEAFAPFVDLLTPLIRCTADPDMVLNNLERFFNATRTPLSLLSLFQRDHQALPTLLEIFATSQYLCNVLINDPELFETVRQTEGVPVPRRQLFNELVGEVDALEKDSLIFRSLRRFKRRQILQIAYGDVIKKQKLEIVTLQLSKVADIVIEAALHAAGRKLYQKRGTPRAPNGAPAQFTILALGKLGGRELNYSSDIDLMFLYDVEGMTDLNPIPNSQYFAELGREIVRLLTESTELGAVYRVDMRLRPNGQHGSLAIGFEEALRYYDNRGRTWERQAFIKARPVAGNIELGRAFLKRLEPWIYRRFLPQVDIASIRSLKRTIERNARNEDEELLNVKTGFGGIRDIEFMVQFFQLWHGYELPQLRTGNTLNAIERLEQVGCLTRHESGHLIDAYRFLRKIEHRLQIMFDLQTHTMPKGLDERRKLAMRMGYNDMDEKTALECFDADFKFWTDANRKMLNHHLIDAFQDDGQTAAEVDLLLDPEPEESQIKAALEKYHFDDAVKAYRLLIDLADEKNPYFFARRCRQFLIAIAPELLRAVAETPAPMQTLKTLATVADALGEKGGLWELFSFHPPSLRLFVRFCALAPFLTDLLCRDPGMFDGLMDNLVLDKLPSRNALDTIITRLVAKAEQIEPILSGFKNDMMLVVGARDVLGKSDIRETTGLLSDIAELCLKQLTIAEYRKMVKRYGQPVIGHVGRGSSSSPHTESTILPNMWKEVPESEGPIPCRFAIVGLGKFGGREMNYHSDLDLLFVYEADGVTAPSSVDENGIPLKILGTATTESVGNQVFFSILAQRIVKRITYFGPWGKLYDVDLRLRPMGKSGSLATPLTGLMRYFRNGPGELWERQMLCKARVVFSGDHLVSPAVVKSGAPMNRLILETIRTAQHATPLPENWVEQIRTMRKRLRESSPDDDLKRGPGGTVDIEFIVQKLQLLHGASRPEIFVPNTFDALDKLYAAGILVHDDYRLLRNGYRFLRTLESCLRLINMPSTKQIPTNPYELKRLALLAGFESVAALIEKIEETTNGITACFNRFFGDDSGVRKR